MKRIIISLLFVILATQGAYAQNAADDGGLYILANGNPLTLSYTNAAIVANETNTSGFNIGGTIGYLFKSNFAIEAIVSSNTEISDNKVSGSTISDYTASTFELGAVALFQPDFIVGSVTLMPYIGAGAGFGFGSAQRNTYSSLQATSTTETVTLGSFMVLGGLRFNMSIFLADIGLKYNYSAISQSLLPDDLKASSFGMLLRIGVQF